MKLFILDNNFVAATDINFGTNFSWKIRKCSLFILFYVCFSHTGE